MSPVAGFALAAYRQDEDRVDVWHETVERGVAARSMPDHQLTLAASCGPTDQRTMGEDVNGLHDFDDACGCIGDVVAGHVVEEAIKVIDHARRQLDPSH